jgi:Flp pilus assembly pilin Flp
VVRQDQVDRRYESQIRIRIIAALSKESIPMSFLKKLFSAFDGLDRVEYGLVIAIIVIGAVTLIDAFRTSPATAYGANGTEVTTNVK